MSDKKKIKVVTHSSGFHTDDIFAVATTLLYLEKTNPGVEVEVIRSRDPEVHKTADYVMDVGDIYNPEENRFDHHQSGGAGKRENGIPYAAFGLVWKQFGEILTGNKKTAEIIDQEFIQCLDAGDNGVAFMESKIPGANPYTVGSLTFLFYPTWKEGAENIDQIFMILVSYAKAIISRLIIVENDSEEGKNLVLNAYNSSADKRIVEVNELCPWEETLNKLPEPLFAYYKNIQGQWSLKGIRDDFSSYELRKKLPQSWAGKRDEILQQETGVSDAVFCHNNLFLAVAKTREGVVKLAELALND